MTEAGSPGRALHLEDFAVGDRWSLPPFSLSAEEIVAFARRWDPQPFHADPDAAAQTQFGGLIASGIHTLAATIRAQYEGLLSRVAAVAGVGFDTLRFKEPVRPGRQLRGEICVRDVSLRREDRGWGQVTFHLDLRDDDGTQVMWFDNRVLIWSRESDPANDASA